MKTKKQKRILVMLLISSIALLFGFVSPMPIANAVDSLTDARDLITDSDVSQVADHTFTFTTTNATPQDGYIDIVFPADFSDVLVANVGCPANWTETAPTTETARCTADNLRGAGPLTFTVDAMTNPNYEGSQLIEITQYDDTGEVIARVQVRVAIIQDVWMTARVQATLTFTLDGVASSTVVNGVTCNMPTAATSVPFGILNPDTPKSVCQQLSVTTNADDGYTVTVWEDDEMTSDSGSNINSFNNAPDNTGSTTPVAWEAPYGWLDNTQTYGHMGLTSEDATLSTGDPFGASLYAGFTGTTPIEVMYHTGPSDGNTAGIGRTNVAYTAEVSALQEAGDYENTLTYICTPQY